MGCSASTWLSSSGSRSACKSWNFHLGEKTGTFLQCGAAAASDSSASRKKVHSVKPPSGNSAGVLVFRTNSGKCYEVIAPPCTQVFRTFLRGIRLERLRCVYLRAGFIRPGKRLLQCTVSPRNETGRTNFVSHMCAKSWNFRALVGLERGPCVEKRY